MSPSAELFLALQTAILVYIASYMYYGVFFICILLAVKSLIKIYALNQNPKRPEPKHILITGASSGIGESLALGYASKGNVIILTGRDITRLETVAKGCQDLGAEVVKKQIDVTDEKEMTSFMQSIDNQYPLDLVIANAGVSGSMLGNLPAEEKIRNIFNTNVIGVLNTILPILPKFRERKNGQIVAVSSIAAWAGIPRSIAYQSSKCAIVGFCRDLRALMKPYNVAVSCICPGFVRSRMTEARAVTVKGGFMPFFWETKRATDYIRDQLSKDVGLIVFPFQMFAIAYLFSILPPVVLPYIYFLGKKFNLLDLSWNNVS